ncbi:hypothetical protein EC950183_0930, partial [Escherichia coli 95.0183]
KSVGFCLEADK